MTAAKDLDAQTPDLDSYSRIIVALSGGKDSIACLLRLLEAGVPKERIELWHHDVDGREGSELFDWPVTRSYCAAVGEAFGIPVYFSWREGGFEREMTKDQARTAPVCWENPDGTIGKSGGTRGKIATRRKFPQISASLSVRWCSSNLKIDVMAAAICGQSRFKAGSTLVVTGERAEESAARASYKTFEPHRTDRRAGFEHLLAGEEASEGCSPERLRDLTGLDYHWRTTEVKSEKALRRVALSWSEPNNPVFTSVGMVLFARVILAPTEGDWALAIRACESLAVLAEGRWQTRRGRSLRPGHPNIEQLLLDGDVVAERETSKFSAARLRPGRHVDHWRPVHGWDEAKVWAIMERWLVVPHPCYSLGFSRCSCMFCIFGNGDQFRTAAEINPKGFERLVRYEEDFGVTMKRRVSLRVLAEGGTGYAASRSPEGRPGGSVHALAAMDREFPAEDIIAKPGHWRLPAGAFGESCGPS